MSAPNEIPTKTSAQPRTALMVAGGIGLAGIGLAAGMLLRSPAPTPPGTAAVASTVAEATDAAPASAAQTATEPDRPAPTGHGTRHEARREPTPPSAGQHLARAEPSLATQPAALCADCGVIEGVRAVQRQGQGTGLGAVAGGVLGGVVGHQLGGGTGKTALTLLGAIGGGLAGNEVEKRQRADTVYEVRVRMDDGTLRTFTQASAPAPGTRVTVDTQGLHVADRAPAPTYTRTSANGAS